MNCKQGDLAVVVRSYAGNEGRIVRCVQLDEWRSKLENLAPGGEVCPPEPIWTIEPELPDFCGELSDYIADSQLRPIRDPGDDAVDEMTLLAGKPEGVTA